jgi:hypothetical protein
MSGLRGEPTVQLRSAYSSDAIIPELAADYRPGEAPEVTLRTVGPRSWVRRWSTDAKGTLAAVPCGEYAVSWKSAGSLRTGTLKVGHERSRFELQSAAAPSSKVEVTGIPDPADSDPGDFLVLIDRSDAAAFLPDTVRDSLAFAPMAGCGVTNLFELPDKPAGDGILRFSCVSPGRYEVRTFRRPRVLSRCVVVPDGVNGTVRVSADFEPQEGRIRGRLRGSDQGKEWIVEARIRGEFSRSQRLRPGGSYEVSGLAPGLYSVWVHREDWGREARRGQPLPESPWKNVVVDGRNTVTLDFDIE